MFQEGLVYYEESTYFSHLCEECLDAQSQWYYTNNLTKIVTEEYDKLSADSLKGDIIYYSDIRMMYYKPQY